MIPVQPNFIGQPFARGGDKNAIPNSGGEILGSASWQAGFPRITETPLNMGGVPPQRKDFNGILNAISSFCHFAQSGGVFAYSEELTYIVGCVVNYNNVLYRCIRQNGADSNNGVQAPTQTTYWTPLIDYLLDGLAVGTPIGTIIMWASSTNPQDGGVWLDCNGQSCAAYPKLVSVLGANTVPNLQGLFPRCVGSQELNVTINGTTTSQTFTGGTVGTKQSDAIRNITGWLPLDDHKAGSIDTETTSDKGSGAFYNSGIDVPNSDNEDSGNASRRCDFNSSRVVPVAMENRPANVALRFLIKAQ